MSENSDRAESNAEVGAELEGFEQHAEPVLVFQAGSNEEAEVVRATLAASGIPAVLQAGSVNPVLGGLDAPMRDTAALGVYVRAQDLEAARTLLTAPEPSEEELAEEEASDPTTLEEAEAKLRNS